MLNLIGGCKVALSALCSKLMSLGVLLVGYELKTANSLQIGIAHIECQGYDMPESLVPNPVRVHAMIPHLCLRALLPRSDRSSERTYYLLSHL